MNYLLSVVIPTKDRYIYLKDCLKSLVDLNSNQLEIIVQDNTIDNAEILDYIQTLNSSHIKYFHSTEKLSQTENSELAVNQATGKYCCYIGDDDSLTYAALKTCEYLDAHNISACVCNVATYHWPDVVFEGKPKPSLSFDDRIGKVEMLKSVAVLKSVFSYGVQDIKYLARVYHGIIARDVLLQIKEITGVVFPGPSPDMANAIAATTLLDQYVYVSRPLIISGYSYRSAGGLGLRGAHKGSLKDAKQLPENAEAEWSNRVPKVWLGYTVWPESAEKALIKLGKGYLINNINYSAMYAKIFLRYPEYRHMVFENVRGLQAHLSMLYECFRFMTRWMLARVFLFIRKKTSQQYIHTGSISLIEACAIVNEHNRREGMNAWDTFQIKH